MPSTFCGVKLKVSTNSSVTGRLDVGLNVPPGPPLLARCGARGQTHLICHCPAALGSGRVDVSVSARAPLKIWLCAVGAAAVVGMI